MTTWFQIVADMGAEEMDDSSESREGRPVTDGGVVLDDEQ